MDCIFCKIVSGSVPSFKVFENSTTLAFMDINPLSEGHVLVIPKTHAANLWEIEDASLRETISTARLLAHGLKNALGLDSMNMVQSNGPGALQSVDHFHLHLIPRKVGDGVPLDWNLSPGNREKIKSVAAKISAGLPK